MKLQYLGDYRDAFKWDLLHWLCSTSGAEVASLLFVPLLTPDDPNPRDGQVPHDRFRARPEVQRFVAELKGAPRGLLAIADLGTLTQEVFAVSIHAPGRYIAPGSARADYWHQLTYPSNSIVFLDPDNGFETKTCSAVKWVRHSEVKSLLEKLPRSSALVIYQHRPRRTWADVFGDLSRDLGYAAHASATYDSTLAFIIVGTGEAARCVSAAAMRYARHHPLVLHKRLLDSGA